VEDEVTIRPGQGIGPIELGQSMAALAAQGEPMTFEGTPGVVFRRLGLLAMGHDRVERVITGLTATARRYRTEGGASVGDPAGRVTQEFGVGEHGVTWRGILRIRYRRRGIVFRIRDGAIASIEVFHP
jgi:hypothetical protein